METHLKRLRTWMAENYSYVIKVTLFFLFKNEIQKEKHNSQSIIFV